LLQPFKYLKDKPLVEFDHRPTFPQMLTAEREGLITITFSVPDEVVREFESTLVDCYCSNDASTQHAAEWNGVRTEIISQALHQHLLPAASASTREHLRERNEAMIAADCSYELQQVSDSAACYSEPTDSLLTNIGRVFLSA
jgi:transcriptional accessory protein Tex/SPT6